MTTTRKDLNACTVELTVHCSEAQIKAGWNKALKAAGKQVRVPGFRPGMAPASMVEKLVNPDALRETAIEEIVRPAYETAIRESGLAVHGTPRLTVDEFDRDPAKCVFTAKIGLEPRVTMGEYKGIEVTKPSVEVSDEDIDRQVDEFRRRGGRKQAVKDRGASVGDMAVVNIKPEGLEANNFMIVVGQSFASLDDVLVGMEVEGIKHAKLSFPADFQQKEWAGQDVEATVTVRSLTEVSTPEADDAFARTLNAENLENLRDQIREGLARMKEDAASEMMTEQILEKLLSTSEVEVSDNTWEEVADRRLQEMDQELRKQNTDLVKFAENQGMSIDQFVAAQQEEAKVHVKRAVLVEQIFRREGLQITQADVDRQFLQVAMENRIPEDQLESFARQYGDRIRDEVVYRAMFSVVTQFLVSNANVAAEAAAAPTAPKKASKAKAESDAPSEEAPKKPKAKKKAE